MSTSNLRLRNLGNTKAEQRSATPSPNSDQDEVQAFGVNSPAPRSISTLEVLRVLAGLFLLSSSLSYFVTNDSIFWGYKPSFTRLSRVQAWMRGPLLLTESELSIYNGTDSALPIYLALNSTIYDVSASPHLYGLGGSYHFFSGRDATRAFVTGCFDEDLTPDIRGVEEMFVPEDLDVEPVGAEGEEGKKAKRDWKIRRERAWRLARVRVRESVKGWQQVFDGGKGGKYFRVGRVKREEGWEERLGEQRNLCKQARGQRPKIEDREVA